MSFRQPLQPPPKHVLMLLENACACEDNRVLLEAQSLIEAGFEVTIISHAGDSGKWVENVDGVRMYLYPRPYEFGGFLGYVYEYGYSLTAIFLCSLFVFFRRGFDVVHVHTPPDMTALIAIFYQLLGKKFVFDHHDLSPELYLAQRDSDQPNLVHRILLYFERTAVQRADRVIATNESQKKVQVERCAAESSRCYVVRNGPHPSLMGPVEPLPELRQPGRLVLGYVGVVGVQDGVDNFVRTIHDLKVRHQRDDFIAVIVGGGPALEGLKKLSAELGVADRIQFTGLIPFVEVPRYIASFDICCTPDPSNPYNDSCTTMKTMEYMAMRKPTVCFRTHENELTAGDAALYADNNDLVAYAKATARLMDDPHLRTRMGELGRERIDDGLTWNHQARNLIKLYEDLFVSAPRPVDRSDEKCTFESSTVCETLESSNF